MMDEKVISLKQIEQNLFNMKERKEGKLIKKIEKEGQKDGNKEGEKKV